MRRIKMFGFLLILMLVTACTPVVYDTANRGYQVPARNASTQTYYYQKSHHQKSSYQQIHPIEVTFYTDKAYKGVYFRPIWLVIADGEYVEIPVIDRKGRHKIIYAHYQNKILHFDSGKNYRNIHGSSSYSYDKSWIKGRKYKTVKIGKKYDLSGLRLKIRNAPAGQHHIKKIETVKLVNKTIKVSLAGGTVMIDGRKVKFAKTSLKLNDGESRIMTLLTKDGFKARVPISYRNGVLKLAYNGNQFKSESSWAKGKTYRISTAGDYRLGKVKLTIHSL